MGTNCTPIISDLFSFCYERVNQVDVIETFNSTPRSLDSLLNIDNLYFLGMVSQIYPVELQLHRVNNTDTQAFFRFTIISFRRICFIKRDVLISPLLLFHICSTTNYGAEIIQRIRFARVYSDQGPVVQN